MIFYANVNSLQSWLLYSAILGAALLAFRKWMSGNWCKSKARLDGKVVLITGGNTGIGKATAIGLAARGASIILACRDVGRAKEAANEIRSEVPGAEVEVQQLNLASLHSIRNFAKEITASKTFVHILINNAGVAFCPESKTEDGFELQFGVNHLGHFLLTLLLLKNIKVSVPARIINLSSLVHSNGTINFENINLKNEYGPFKAYFQSKLANVLFSRELARRLRGTGISVYCVNPGPVNTELGRHIENYLIQPIAWIYQLLSSLAIKTPEQGAQTSIFCAVDEDIKEHSGFYYSDCKQKVPSPQAMDEIAAHKLWLLSEELVGLKKAM